MAKGPKLPKLCKDTKPKKTAKMTTLSKISWRTDKLPKNIKQTKEKNMVRMAKAVKMTTSTKMDKIAKKIKHSSHPNYFRHRAQRSYLWPWLQSPSRLCKFHIPAIAGGCVPSSAVFVSSRNAPPLLHLRDETRTATGETRGLTPYPFINRFWTIVVLWDPSLPMHEKKGLKMGYRRLNSFRAEPPRICYNREYSRPHGLWVFQQCLVNYLR